MLILLLSGCATWPACEPTLLYVLHWLNSFIVWTNGPNWPANGEIDIVEGVNNYTNNQATIHTNPGCSIASSNATVLDITGSVVGGTDCSAADSGNQGCGMRSPQNNSFGSGFNANGGGVYASMLSDLCLLVPHRLLTLFMLNSAMG
jgi:hypothetical protein